ncbi:hypothetical protein UlMin_028524 [Ulmus minor]
MSRKNHGLSLPMKGVHDAPYGRERGLMLHPTLYEEMRESQYGMVHRPLLPPHPAIFKERLAAQHQDIQAFLVDNQRLIATHVTLKQDLEVSQHELQHMAHLADSVRVKKDVQMRDLYEKYVSLELDLRGHNATRQELTGKTQDLTRITTNLQQIVALRAEIEAMKQELCIEYEKKGYAENYEHGQIMEKKLISMARELEKLGAKMANTENREHAIAKNFNQWKVFYTILEYHSSTRIFFNFLGVYSMSKFEWQSNLEYIFFFFLFQP